MQSRAAALGWGVHDQGGRDRGQHASGRLRPESWTGSAARPNAPGWTRSRRSRDAGWWCIFGNVDDPLAAGRVRSQTTFGDGPLVVGPTVPHLFAAGRSARAALAGQSCAHAWPGAPRPVTADDLLAERVLVGDAPARALLLDRICAPSLVEQRRACWRPPRPTSRPGAGLEGTARVLFVHPNTVRYRLGNIADLTGYQSPTRTTHTRCG